MKETNTRKLRNFGEIPFDILFLSAVPLIILNTYVYSYPLSFRIFQNIFMETWMGLLVDRLVNLGRKQALSRVSKMKEGNFFMTI